MCIYGRSGTDVPHQAGPYRSGSAASCGVGTLDEGQAYAQAMAALEPRCSARRTPCEVADVGVRASGLGEVVGRDAVYFGRTCLRPTFWAMWGDVTIHLFLFLCWEAAVS